MPRIGEGVISIPVNGHAKGNGKPSDALPPALKPFRFHGIGVSYREGQDECWCECPFCGKEKLAINAGTGLWSCKVCAQKGNALTFLRILHEVSRTSTDASDLEALREDRGLAGIDGLQSWGVCKSVSGGDWIVPGIGADGKLAQLYRYAPAPDGKGGRILMATPKVSLEGGEEISHQLMGAGWDMDSVGQGRDKASPGFPWSAIVPSGVEDVYVCEGPWDGIALWELMRSAKEETDDCEESLPRLVFTGSRTASLLEKGCVVASPGANVWKPAWNATVQGKRITFLYDNDHPRVVPASGLVVAPVGWEGMRRAAESVTVSDYPAKSVRVLRWNSVLDHEKELKDGTDVRDILTARESFNGSSGREDSELLDINDRLALLAQLLTRLAPMPEDWAAGRTESARKSGGTDMRALPCVSWSKLSMSCKRAMKWTEGLDRAFSVMLACAASTMAQGDQLWVKVIGPPSCGKSTLCEALSANRSYVKALSTMRGFHSGFRGENSDDDTSLLAQIGGMTLVIKDGDTLLQSPNLGQVLSEGRDIYDRVSRAHYRNRISREYENLSMTWILCGTSSLRQLDSSELGERFLDCVIMDGVDDELEDEILSRVARKAIRSAATSSVSATGSAGSGHSPEMVEMMRLTAGYLDFLRASAIELVEKVHWSEDAQAHCIRLAKFTSYMRARPSKKQDETVERELGARLLSQLIRLGSYLAVVLNKSEIDGEVLRRVARTALDTSRGTTMQLCGEIAKTQEAGIDAKSLPILTGLAAERCTLLVRFLRRIGAVENFRPAVHAALSHAVSPIRLRLSERMRKLWDAVMRDAGQG